MRKMWKQKWVVVGAAMVIFLSVGTVAWAASAGNSATDLSAGATGANAVSLTANSDAELPAGSLASLKSVREKMKERRDQFLQRQETLYSLLREKMSPTDQAAYDRLVEQAKNQREALEKARTDLQSTMQDLRDLTHKYIEAESGTTNTGAESTQ